MDFNLHFGVVLFMMEFLVQAKNSKRKYAPCVGGKWIEVGSYRFWQRVKCALRRVDADGQLSVDDLPSMEAGPDRNATFNPSYGFEPYWADGDWVFDKKPDSKGDVDNMCGTKCSKVYVEYGTICGRNKYFSYRTFENYCQLRNADCHDVEKWMMLYKGACYKDLKEYNRLYPISNAKIYINSYMQNHNFTQSYVGFCDTPSTK